MKAKELLAFAMAVVLSLAVAAPAMADTSPKAITAATDSATFDVTTSIDKDNATVSDAESYYVKVSWTVTPGSYTMNGDTYTWDAENMKYTRATQESDVGNGTPATATIKVANQSNVVMDYAIVYTAATDTTTNISSTETVSTGTKSGSLQSYTDRNSTAGDVTSNTSGATEITNPDWTAAEADSATYVGSIALTEYTADSYPVASETLGSYTVTLNKTTGVVYTLTGSNAPTGTKLTSVALLKTTDTVTYNDGKCTAYNGYISATKYANWADAKAFVSALNTAKIAPSGKTWGGTSGDTGTGYWRLLSSKNDATAWYTASGSQNSFGSVSYLWSSAGDPFLPDNAYYWNCGDGSWDSLGFVKTASNSSYGFVVIWEQN